MAKQHNLLSNYTQQELTERVKSVIATIKYITIATVSPQGEPWSAPAFFAYDKDYNLYWGSPKDSQKSQNIRANGQAYIVIYDSTVQPGSGKGVYIRAIAYEVSDPVEMRKAFDTIMERRDGIPYWEFEEFQPDKPIRLYTAIPQHVYTNGGKMINGFYIDSRAEVTL